MAAAVVPLLVASTVMAAGGMVMSGVNQSRTASYNAEMAEYNAGAQRQEAELARRAGSLEKLRREQEGEKLISRQRAMFGKSGLETESGSPLQVMMDTAADVERDALLAEYNYKVRGAKLDSAAALEESKADYWGGQAGPALWGGLLGGAAQMFKGGSMLYGGSPLSQTFNKGGFDSFGSFR